MQIINIIGKVLLIILLIILQIVIFVTSFAMGICLLFLYALLALNIFHDTNSVIANITAIWAIIWFGLIVPGRMLIDFWADDCGFDFADDAQDVVRNIFYYSMYLGIILTILSLIF